MFQELAVKKAPVSVSSSLKLFQREKLPLRTPMNRSRLSPVDRQFTKNPAEVVQYDRPSSCVNVAMQVQEENVHQLAPRSGHHGRSAHELDKVMKGEF